MPRRTADDLAAAERYSRRRYPALDLRAPVRPPERPAPAVTAEAARKRRRSEPVPGQMALWSDPPKRRDYG
jgi:hypothetical protein